MVIAGIIAGCLAGALGASAVLRQPSRYASRTLMQIDQPLLIATSGGEGPIPKLNQLRTKYALLARTTRITGPVAKRTGFPAGAIAGAVNVTLPGPSLLLIVEARATDPGRARVIADATAEELALLVKSEMQAAKVPQNSWIVLSVVSPAQPGVKFEPSRNRAVTVGTLSGFLSLVGFIVIAETARTYRRRR